MWDWRCCFVLHVCLFWCILVFVLYLFYGSLCSQFCLSHSLEITVTSMNLFCLLLIGRIEICQFSGNDCDLNEKMRTLFCIFFKLGESRFLNSYEERLVLWHLGFCIEFKVFFFLFHGSLGFMISTSFVANSSVVGGRTLQLQCIFNVLVFILACAEILCLQRERVRSSYARVSKSRKLAKEAAYYLLSKSHKLFFKLSKRILKNKIIIEKVLQYTLINLKCATIFYWFI